MSLQWTFIATFLYAEIFAVILLILPFVSSSRWHRVFKSRILRNMDSHSHIYFNVLILVLALLFVDAIREVRKYGNMDSEPDARAEALLNMKLFRAQRNFYIAGFALFLWLVIKRLVVLISANATLGAQSEASLKQAQSATEAAKKMLDDKDKDKKGAVMGNLVDAARAQNEPKKQLDKTLLELEKTKEELYHARLDMDSLRKQAEGTAKEYDRLTEEYSKLEKKLAIMGGGEENSKDK